MGHQRNEKSNSFIKSRQEAGRNIVAKHEAGHNIVPQQEAGFIEDDESRGWYDVADE